MIDLYSTNTKPSLKPAADVNVLKEENVYNILLPEK